MSISTNFIEIIEKISKRISIPPVRDIIIPKVNRTSNKSNFAVVILEDNTSGIFFINLSTKVKEIFQNLNSKVYKGLDPLKLARKFQSKKIFEKSLGLGAINAISQFLFNMANYSFRYVDDSLGLLRIQKSDIIGMVGLFPSLVRTIEQIGSKLIIIEKKSELLTKGKNWRVTLNPTELTRCNKVLITSTTVLNETIDEILDCCSNAEKISMIGPTAGFLPDPLFKRGIHFVGGSHVVDSMLFEESIRNNQKWRGCAKKYIIRQSDYIGYETVLKKASFNLKSKC